MKKVIILIMVVFLLTGCAVKYNIVINDDLTIIEKAEMTGTSEFFNNYYKTTKVNVLKTFIEIYQSILEENNYQIELVEDTTPYVIATKKYDNVLSYTKDSILFNGYFDEVKYTEDGNIKKIETIGFNDNEPDNPDRFNVQELEITINCPYKVTNHNASKVDVETNTFYYTLDEENDKIIFEYDASVKYSPRNSIFSTIILCLLAIVACWVIVIILNKKNNKNN